MRVLHKAAKDIINNSMVTTAAQSSVRFDMMRIRCLPNVIESIGANLDHK